jgi:hypothetical protein
MTAGAETTELPDETTAGTGAGAAAGSAAESAAAPPPGPPRPLTPRVSRRAWAEPHVRFWWVLTLVLLGIGAYVGGSHWLAWSREVRMIRSGRVVDAEILTAGGLSSRWQQLPPDSIVTLRYEVDGKTYDQTGYLKGRTEFILVHSKVPVRVDPADPNLWTARTVPASLAQELTGALVVLPAFLALAAVSLVLRARTARVWRDGDARRAIVVESRQTALAPRSRLVRCTPADAGDNRVVQVYVPAGAAAGLHAGDELWLLFPPGRRGRPVAAAWFEQV